MYEDEEIWKEFKRIVDDCERTKDYPKMRRRLNLLKLRMKKLEFEGAVKRRPVLINELGEFF